MPKVVDLILRGLQFFWTLLIMALVGNMIQQAVGGNPSIVNYAMFVAVFSMLTLVYQIAATLNEGFVVLPVLPLALDAANALFFLVGGIALAAYLGVRSCTDADYVNSNLVTAGSFDNIKRCREAQASTAFLWFGFAAYVASLVFAGLHAANSPINLRGGIGGIRRGGGGGAPSMSQV